MRYLILAIVILSFVFGLLLGNIVLTGMAVSEEEYSWTRAICNSDNECIDVLIECNKGNVVNITPLSGFVYHEDNWRDPRNETGYC